MNEHKQWETIQAYFRDIPIHQNLIDLINLKLECNKNILIMILKEKDGKHTPKEKFKALCDLYPNEVAKCKIVIATVPDIIRNERVDL